MRTKQEKLMKPAHFWLNKLGICFVSKTNSPLLTSFIEHLQECFEEHGHAIYPTPTNQTDIILTTLRFGEVLSWREGLLFTARKKFRLAQSPTIFTCVHITPEELRSSLAHFEQALSKDEPDLSDYDFPGLAPNGYQVLHTQGKRGGAMLSLVRLLQAQTKCIRILLLVGDDKPEKVFHMDLVGAFPSSDYFDSEYKNSFYDDIVLRMATYVSTREITHHEVVEPSIPYSLWRTLTTPKAMQIAAREFGKRDFFTDMLRIPDLVHIPVVSEVVSKQYSEGCFATWEPKIDGLITTITGSARPVDKDNITEDDLAVIIGVRKNHEGAQVRQVDGKNKNDWPSSEAVELIDMDITLPKIHLNAEWGISSEVPVIRSKLHGHRGILSFNPKFVEFVRLPEPYYYYPVSCATEAQALGIKAGFADSQALNNPDDLRQVVFTILPTHGIVIAEKWVYGKKPFEIIWEFMDAGNLVLDNFVPQGLVEVNHISPSKSIIIPVDG